MSPLLASPFTAAPTLASPPQPLAPPPPQESEAPEPETREFGDALATRKAIFERAQQAAAGIKPFDNGRHTLSLEDVHYDGPDNYSLAQQKAAILEGRSLGRRLRGTWRLKDNASGKDIEVRKSTLATIPYLTPRGTFINRGSEYSIINQFRLNPGIYTRQKENGEIEAHVNVMPGEGKTHRYFLDPAKGVFYARLGQAKLPLLPLLRAFGVTDKQLQEAWGPELYSANMQDDSPAALNKYYERVLPPKQRTGDEPVKRQALIEAFRNMKLNPETTRRTLGQPYDKVDADTILATTKKLLAVSRGEADVDDRDHLAYQSVVGPEDLISERLAKDYGGLQRTLFRKASLQGNLRALQANALNKQVQAALLHSGLGQNLEETNASEIFDKQYRITRMGEGGIPSLSSIPDEARAVQPSHLSMVDPLRTPESLRAGVDVYLARAARKGADGKIYAPFQDARTGKTVHRSAQDVADLAVAFPKEMDREGPRAWALQNGKIRSVAKKDVDLVVPVFEDAFSPLANMIPFKSATKGQRVAMGSRMITQALPLVKGEAPLVQTGVPGQPGQSYESLYGDKLGAIRADQPARVLSVDAEGIRLRYDDGREEVKEIAHNFPYNRKSVTGDTRVIVQRAGGGIWEGPIAKYAPGDGVDCVLSVDPVTGKTAWQPIIGFTSHSNNKPIYRVCTESGRSVDVTVDHSLIVMGDDGELQPAYPLDCVVNFTRLPVVLWPESTRLSQVQLTADRGLLAGLYLSEGHCPPTQPNLIIIAADPPERQAEVMTLFTRLGYEPYVNGGQVCCTADELSSWLTGTFGHLSHGKSIPAALLESPPDFRHALVAGYMAGDGCLWVDGNNAIQVSAVSVSRDLRDGLVDILASLGVFTTLFDAPRNHLNEKWRDGFGFRVISTHLQRLDRWFYYQDREDKFRELLKPKYRASSFELVPVPSKAARKKLYKEFEEVPPYIYKTAHQGAVAKHRLVDGTGPYGKWGRSSVMWDKIVSITPVAEPSDVVYDFSVANSEMFAVCHGLLVHNTFFSQTPMVKPGDVVAPGQMLAKSNYVDDSGASAMGLNARIAYMADGHNFEDAISISQGFANRLSSEHMYSSRLDKTDEHKLGRSSYIGLFPGRFTRKQLETIGTNGVVKPGTIVEPGDPLILAAQAVAPTHNRVHKKGSKSFNDMSLTWDHHDRGEVTDVVDTDKGLAVFVKSVAPMQVGDKLANRYGGKGVIGKIYPDDEMPRDRDGRPLDILVSPTGVISRGNPAQVIETVLGKISEKTGKPYRVADFDSVEDLTTFAEQELAKHGLSDLEDVIEPLTERKVPGILTGSQYFMKLQHTAEGKGQGRGTGGYTAEGAPAKGGIEGSKRIGLLTTNALLSHGATGVLRDASQIRGQRNEDFWLSYMQGYNPPEPDIPTVYKKFVANLQASGVNVVSSGTGSNIMAMTDKDVDELAGAREIKNGETVNFDEALKPVSGGLFDPALTGGHNGNRWSYIKLAEPMPNPVMEEPIRRLLGLTQKQFEGVLSGAEELPRFGGKGPDAIAKALAGINLPREIQVARAEIAGSKKGARDLAIRRLGYLKSAERLGIHPGDWMLSKVPVLPPMFRPISEMGDKKLPLVSDPNYLYRELLDANDNLKTMSQEVDDVSEERSAVYNAFKAVTGLADPLHPKLQEKQVKGILQHVFSNSPKYGTVQRRLLSTTVDTVGRGVITPDPDLDMDSVGIPESRAWDVYKNFVIRRLKRRGLSVLEAARHVEGRTQTARNELLNEMGERPVFVDRAPVLHRFGVMAFWPRLTKDDTVHVSPLVVKGFGADFDGDTVNYHVPVSDEAVAEARERMMPSRNLLSVSDFKTPMHAPGQDYVAGLYAATAKSKKPQRARRFATKADAIRAFLRGDANVDTEIEVDA